jgi:predicted Zn-dependent protease
MTVVAARFLFSLLASSLVIPSALAMPQSPGPTQTPSSGTSSAPSSTASSDSTATAGQSTSTLSDPNQPPTKVKSGSEADVSAVGNRNVGKGINFYSLEHEIALGKQLAAQVDQTSKFVTDPVVTEYVNRVGQNLVRNSDAKVPFTIKVIDNDAINAFALPGGFFYVNSGLILHADEESELAGVMAHEIAHVAARHGTRNATKGELLQMSTIPLMIFGPVGLAGYGLYEGLNIALPLTFLKFSRSAEAEADYLGLQYMYKAGYDPNSFVTFFEKIEAEERKTPGTIPKIFDSHPPTPERIQAAQKEIATILPTRDEYIVTTSDFDHVKKRLQSVQFSAKAQAVSPNKPSLRKRTTPTTTTTTGSPTDTTGTDTGTDSGRPTLKRRTDPTSDPNGPGTGSGGSNPLQPPVGQSQPLGQPQQP